MARPTLDSTPISTTKSLSDHPILIPQATVGINNIVSLRSTGLYGYYPALARWMTRPLDAGGL